MWVTLLKEWRGKPAGEKLDVADEYAELLLTTGTAQKTDGDPLASAIDSALTGAADRFATTVDERITEALKQFAAAAQKSRKNGLPALFGNGGTGDPKQTFGKYLLAVATRDYKALDALGSQWIEPDGRKAALNEQSLAQGAATVPTQFLPRLMGETMQMAIVRPRAMIVPTTSAVIEIPILNITDAPTAGETSFFGGVQANWEEEGSTIGEEEPTLKQGKWQPRELKGYTLASRSLLADDAIGLEALLMRLFGGAIAWHEDRAFLRGTGANQPLGVLASNVLISVARSAASAVTVADVAAVMGRMLSLSGSGLCWVCHPTTIPKWLTMAATPVGGGNVFIGPQIQGKPQMQAFGVPIEITDKVPALNTAGDVGLYDFGMYVIADRQQIEIAFSEHVAFRTNQNAWRFVSRVDGQPWLRSSVTLSDTASTLSPFVTLAAG